MEALDPNSVTLLPPDLREMYFGRTDALFGRYGVPGDGTCFFHSLCAARNTNDFLQVPVSEQKRIGHRFRCAFTDHLTDVRWGRFMKNRGFRGGINADTAREQFCDSKHWADETMICYVSDVCKMNLVFIDATTGKIYCGVRGKLTEPLIVIMWINQSHFEPVVQIKELDAATRKLGVQFVFDSKDDSEIVDAIMNNYRAQCSAD
jgi:hypothetical protein